MAKSYKTVDQLVREMIERYGLKGSEGAPARGIHELLPGEQSVETRDLDRITLGIATNLAQMIQPWIRNGLDITADSPPSEFINITSGSGVAGGQIQILNQTSKVRVPMDGQTTVFFLLLKEGAISFNNTERDDSLTLGKVIVPMPAVTNKILDDKPINNALDGYIISGKDMYFDEDQVFDDASVAVLKDAFARIAAETIFGTLRLSESLKIQNTAGSLVMDSKELRLLYPSTEIGAKFNKDGTFFYNTSGAEVAKFSKDGADIGNIQITTSSIQSKNYIANSRGFKIGDDGNVEFDNAVLRGTIYASGGEIGGFTITDTTLYGGTIQTGKSVGAGETGVVMDTAGLRGYDAILGTTFNLPTDGSAPTFSSGIINNTIFEIQTNAVIRTSETVGDGTANSAGLLINNTGLYGCGPNQLLEDANLKLISDTGDAIFRGTIEATAGMIGNVTVDTTGLYGGLIQGTNFVGGSYSTSSTVPRLLLNSEGLQLQVTESTGKYGDGTDGLRYGDEVGSGAGFYGAGVVCWFGNPTIKTPFYVAAEQREVPDMHLYNRSVQPSGAGLVGDFAVINNNLWMCDSAGSPGIYTEFLKSGSGYTYLPGGTDVAVADGGTSRSSHTAYAVLCGGTTSIAAQQSIASLGSDGDVLISSGAGFLPQFKNVVLWRTVGGDTKLKTADDIDIQNKELKGMLIENRTDDTGCTQTGRLWFRTDV